MKKLITLISILVILASTTQTAFAAEVNTSSEEKAAVSILIKSIDRKTINELFLNEMQYIQLRNLSKQYQKDVAALSSATLLEQTTEEVNLQQLNHRYYTELNSILTAHQLAIFVQQSVVAVAN